MWQEKNDSLYKKFEFKDFGEAVEFINRVADCARELNHHPTLTNTYNVVELWLSTHSAGGKVTDKDRKLAQQIDKLLSDDHVETTKTSIDLPKAKLFTDGGSRGNPGPSALGYVILDADDHVIKKESEYLGTTTNNQAEYQGLLAGLKDARAHGVKELEVYMDSELIIKQIQGLYKVKNQELLPHYTAVKEIAGKFDSIIFTHVPRAMNSIADGMVNECLDSQ
jgi:ribonuclease HI